MKGLKLLISILLLGARFTYATPTAACRSEEYVKDNEHYTQASSQTSTCSVEPESVDDVGTILRIVSSGDTQSPFAVKGAGHTGNVGFSSTTGVQISMSRFNGVEYDESSSTVKIGAGQIWSDVYTLLAPSGVSVVGGRVPGVGRDLEQLTAIIKGGFNNFGVVTSFTVKAYPQTDVWRLYLVMGPPVPMRRSFLSVGLFYDAPMPPSGLFGEYLNIPGATINSPGTMSFPDALQALNGDLGTLNPPRSARYTVPVSRYTVGILDEMKTQFERIVAETKASNHSFISLVITPEPFAQPNAHSTDSAYPHPPGRFVCPSVLELDWEDPASDEFFVNAMSKAQRAIQARAIEEGQSFPDDILYNNYAPASTPLELIYGDNLGRLREIKRRIDPENIMGLAGGFKIDP
ncbi:putative fad dependent oxidoreductase [Moniliophthora roreri]|nr:putative fad dependent oxidoreductase [Moniliophthora roreri]